MSYEYKVVPAPARGLKAKGVKTVEDRFANALEVAINALAVEGWEYIRADTLPCEQREGLMGKTTVYQNMLVFRRAKVAAKTAQTPPQPNLAARAAEPAMVEKRIIAKPKPTVETGDEKPASEKKAGESANLAAQ